MTQEWIPFDPVLLKQINSSIELAKAAGLSCARINSMTRPVDAASSLAKLLRTLVQALARADSSPRMLQRYR